MRILIVFIFFFYNCCFSQFKITHYNSENGLPHDLCYQIIQDKQGYIWLGTDNGLVKFNGNRIVNYTQNQGLESSFVIGVSESASNTKKLVATWGAGAYFFEKNKFTPIGDGGFKHQKLNQIIEFQEKIFVIENKSSLRFYRKGKSTSEVLNLFKIKGKYRWYTPQNAKKITEYVRKNKIASESIQIAKVNNQLFCLPDKYNPKFTNIIAIDGSDKINYPFPFLNNFVIVGLQRKEDHFLAVTTNGLVEFNNQKVIRKRTFNLPNLRVIQFVENQKYEVYLAENKADKSHEIILFDKKTNNYSFLNKKLIKAPVSDILMSKEGILWISTYGNGMFSVSAPEIQIERNFLQNNFFFDFIATPYFNFYATTDKIFYSNKSNSFFNEIACSSVMRFKELSNDTLGITTKKIDPVFKKVGPYYLTNKYPMYKKAFGDFDFIYGDEILYVSKKQKRKEVSLKLPYSSEDNLNIINVIKINDEYWVATNLGIFVLNEDFENSRRISENDGLLSEKIIGMQQRGDKVWILSLQGLTIYTNGKFYKYPYVNDKNDCFNTFMVDSDGSGTVWFGSQKGLVRFHEGQFYRYTKKEGLPSSFYSKIFLNGKGRLLCLGNKGVTLVSSNQLRKTKHLPINLTTNTGSSIVHKSIKVEPDSDFAITAEVINFSDSEYTMEYRLNTDKWTKLTGNTIDFSNFSSGKFSLQFRAKYYFSDWSYSAKITVDKIPVWYLRWYVLVPFVLLLSIILFYLVNRRFKKLRERNQMLQNLLESNQRLENQLNEMRHNIAQDFHDELGNKLAGISVMSDQLLHVEQLKHSDNYTIVERINRDSQDLFQGIRDFIWAIDSKNGTLEELIFALTDFGEELFQYSGIKFIVENEVNEATFLLPHYWNRQLLLLFKEAMTNAFKYSQAKTGILIFKVNGNTLNIEFKDDGIGFDPKTITRKNGLFNVQKRADKLKGQLKIDSFSGTSVVFVGKIK
ncbi:MAG TPA: two-component regulator propeller domain-containing protein [Flavobacterium sp.]|nr:two-component regulator propeller domain-containing protein [Flavobacterium sp.]